MIATDTLESDASCESFAINNDNQKPLKIQTFITALMKFIQPV